MNLFTPKTIAAILLIPFLFLAACDKSNNKATQKELEHVRFNMAWLPQGSMAGVFAAKDKGFYRDAGLDVDIIRGFGGIRTVNELDQGMFEFGYGDPLAVALNRSNGGKTKMIGAINGHWPAGACYIRERHNIEKPQDLKGLRFGGGQASPVQALLPAWLARNGMTEKDLTILQLDPAVIVASLVEGKIDVGECWKGNSIALFQKRAREAGLTIGWLPYADFGLNIYGNGIVTSDHMIKDKPRTVRAFLKATYQGYAFANKHPREAADILQKAYPMLNADVTLQQIKETATLIGDARPMGWIDRNKIVATERLLKEVYVNKDFGTPDDFYTTEFLPRKKDE